MHVGAAQFLGGDVLARRRLHEGRAAQEDGAGALHDDGLVRHRGDVGAAGGARAHHHRDLRNVLGRHARLVEEDAAEVVPVREDLGLERQVGAPRIHQVQTGQVVVERHLLRAQVLRDRERVVGAALHRRIVGDDQHFARRDPSDAGDEAGAGRVVVVHAGGRQRRQLEERRVRDPAAARCAPAPGVCPARDAAAPTARRRLGAPAPAGPRRSATSRSMCARLEPNSAEPGLTWVGRVSTSVADYRARPATQAQQS